jgi:O-antigen ligase
MAFIAAAIAVLLFGQAPQDAARRATLGAGFWWGIALAGLASAFIAAVQVFAPEWPDGDWIARSGVPGRAGANLRQPNHLSSLALWAMVAMVGLSGPRGRRPTLLVVGHLLLVMTLVLAGSRTGVLGMAMLALWGLFDRGLPNVSRISLGVSPLSFGLLWFAVSSWASATGHVFGSATHLFANGTGDISSSRFAIWSNTVSLIAKEPWTGVGYGEFNVAWTLSAFPERPRAFFDHAHNLVLHLLAELGIPLAALTLALLVGALTQAGHRAWKRSTPDGLSHRAAFIAVLMIGLHGMLEYPLWYGYFLLPTAFAWGFALAPVVERSNGLPPTVKASASSGVLAIAGMVMLVGALGAMLDYWRVIVIYDPPENAAPLEERIARGQRSPLFGQHADYAAATAFGEPKAPLTPSQELAFKRAPHQLLDIRLMIAWSQALAAQGELDKARWLAARIREFRNPGSDEYFAPCSAPALAAKAFQCQPPTRVVDWREFVQR